MRSIVPVFRQINILQRKFRPTFERSRSIVNYNLRELLSIFIPKPDVFLRKIPFKEQITWKSRYSPCTLFNRSRNDVRFLLNSVMYRLNLDINDFTKFELEWSTTSLSCTRSVPTSKKTFFSEIFQTPNGSSYWPISVDRFGQGRINKLTKKIERNTAVESNSVSSCSALSIFLSIPNIPRSFASKALNAPLLSAFILPSPRARIAIFCLSISFRHSAQPD